MIAPPDIRQAARKLAKWRKDRRAARPRPTRSPDKRQRQPRERDPGFLAFIRRQPCCAGPAGCSGAIEAAHLRFASAARGKPLTGMQTKPDDRYAVPLCVAHHRAGPDAQHSHGESAWWAMRGLDPLEIADRLFAEYRSQP